MIGNREERTRRATPSQLQRAPVAALVALLLLCGTMLPSFGCSIFEANDDPSRQDGVCTGVSHDFADTVYPEVTPAQCEESGSGEWIDGRCYCHGPE